MTKPDKVPPSSQIMEITPKLATSWLAAFNSKNRPFKSGQIAQYAADMKSGAWDLNGETIKFGQTRLLDGQNRLRACVEANVPFTSWVTFGLEDDVFDTIDGGAPRTAGDLTYISGAAYHNETAAACRLCVGYLEDKARGLNVTKHAVNKFYQENPAIAKSITAVKSQATKWAKRYAAPAAAVAYLGSHGEPAKAKKFLDQFMHGEDLNKSNPVWHLRNRIMSDQMNKADRFALFVMAWNAFAQDRPIAKLQAPRSDKFPKIAGAIK